MMDTIIKKSKTTVAKFEEFFSTPECRETIFEALSKYPNEKSVTINYLQLEIFDHDLANLLIEKPEEVIKAAEKAIKNVDTTRKNAFLHVRFENMVDNIPLGLLRSKYIGKFVAVEGIVRKTNEIRPRIVNAMFECRSCMRLHEIPQTNNNINKPVLCQECGGKLFRLIQEESEFIDTQTIIIQESLGYLADEEQLNQINILLEDDLVGNINLGDVVRVIGTLKTVRDEKTKLFKSYIDCNYIELLDYESEVLQISEEDEAKIHKLAEDPDIYNKIINSIIPSLYGYNELKEAIALQLFGGSAKELEDKTRIRGDIHILIVGDPKTGKTQLLDRISKIAPKGLLIKGNNPKNELGVKVNEDHIESCELTLVKNGIACIDTFTKLKPINKATLEELMENQTVTSNLPLIKTKLHINTSILAADRPKFGYFDRYKSIAEQIDISRELLSEFDLVFIIEDRVNSQKDKNTAKHILGTYMDGLNFDESNLVFLKKYVAYAKKQPNPKLTEEAIRVLQEFYVGVRGSADEDSPVPITARQLETLVRLSEANCKIRLGQEVTAEDAKRVINLQQECLKQAGYDPQNDDGTDNVEGRTPKSERDKARVLLDVIKELSEEYGGRVPVLILADEMAERYNISEDKVAQIIAKLKYQGLVFEPAKGYLKTV
ncbi:minichromosome maintenance protein MCM [Methanobacterium sp. MBAC-LM]|uniref:minichromosome maintenance protein MCM n=1 Tax=Methanobacterium sp. MBAC-LM TaxID=3412034 RepID=UPI003C7762D1